MNQTTISNNELNQLCRGCMSTNIDELQNIFNDSLAELFSSITSLTVSTNDGLPTVICSSCIECLQNHNAFKLKCIKTHKILLDNALNKIKIENQIIADENTDGKRFKSEISEAQSEQIKDYKESTILMTRKISTDEELFEEKCERTDSDSNSICDNDESFENSNENKSDDLKNDKPHKHDGPFDCNKCGKILKTKATLRDHLKTHVNEGPFPCDKCERIFKFKGVLNKHKKTHTRLPIVGYQCDICKKIFSIVYNLKKHILVLHAKTQRVVCEQCGKSFSEPVTLRRHICMNSQRKEFTCPKCSKVYTSIGGYNYHMLKHSGKKPFMCNYCGQCFEVKDTLTMHIRMHTGEKPYHCSVCNRPFRNLSGLRNHQQIHKEHRPNTNCPICQMSIKPQSLKQHMIRHTEQPKYICDLCPKAYYNACHLREHRILHMGQNPHECKLCQRSYSSKSHLKRHIQKTHPK